MKILYTNFHGAPGIGGHTSYILRLAQALAPRHEITVAAPAGSALLRLAPAISGVKTVPQAFPNGVGRMARALAPMRELLRREAFDLVHVNGSSDHRLLLLAALGMGSARPAVVFTKHNDIPVRPFGAALRARAGTDHVIAVCEFVARELAATPYRRCGITPIPNGIDVEHFSAWSPEQAQAMRAQWVGADAHDTLLLGSNAGTDDYKGWINLVRALALLPAEQQRGVRIVLAGSPPAQSLRDEVSRLGMDERVSYAGRLDDVRPFLAGLDAGFVLSHRIETISFACREMMAMGKPVIVTRHAGLPENITPGVDGWVVPVQDPAALAGWLREVLAARYDLRAMGINARAKAEREFGLEPFVSRTEAVYESVVARRRS